MVFVVSMHTGLDEGRKAKEQLDRMKNKLNEVLRVEKGCNEEAPFGFIEQVKNTGAWGDKNEGRWRVSGVHEDEPRPRITEVMRTQMEAVCTVEKVGVGLVFANEMNPNLVVVIVPREMGEGVELLEKMRMENEDIAVTPRWPLRLGETSRKWRVEVRMTAETRRLIEKKSIRIGGKDAEVVP